MKEKEKKDNKEVKDLVKRAEETASQGKKDTTKEKPEVKKPEVKTPPKIEPKPEPKPEKDPEKEALKGQVKILTERVGSIEGLLKEAAEAAKTMQQGQGQGQEELTDEQRLEQLQQQQGQGQGQAQGQAQAAFGPNSYFLLGKLFDMLGKVVPTAMIKSAGGGNSAGPEGILKQLEFWTNIIGKIQGNFISGLKLLPAPVREESFKRMIESPRKEEGIEE